MHSSTLTEQAQAVTTKTYRPDWIYICQLHDGRYAIGQASNPSKRISALNSGFHPLVTQALAINSIIGIKEQNDERTFSGVVSKFCKRYGTENVLAL